MIGWVGRQSRRRRDLAPDRKPLAGIQTPCGCSHLRHGCLTGPAGLQALTCPKIKSKGRIFRTKEASYPAYQSIHPAYQDHFSDILKQIIKRSLTETTLRTKWEDWPPQQDRERNRRETGRQFHPHACSRLRLNV